MIRLFFMYLKAENQKRIMIKGIQFPIICLALWVFHLKIKLLMKLMKNLINYSRTKPFFSKYILFFAKLTTAYSKEYIRANNSDYNVMIKQEIDTSIYRHCLSMLQDFEYPDNVKWFIES